MNQKLRDMMNEREIFLNQEDYENPRCDELRNQIMTLIYTEHENLTVEDIFEGLTSIGAAPSLIYDDNGHFAMGGDGMQGIDLKFDEKAGEARADFGGTWFFRKEDWSNTVRGAIRNYFKRNQN